MTREEALYELCNLEHNPLNIINMIYNDFESQTCENCKYWNKYRECQKLFYHDDHANHENLETDSDFSCNRFKAKG